MMLSKLKTVLLGLALISTGAISAPAPALADDAKPALPSDTIEAGMLTTAPPFAYLDGGQYKGMTYDILQAVAKDGGFKIHVSPLTFAAMIPAMQARQIDVAVAGFYVTDARKKIIDFSSKFFTEGSVLVVPTGSSVKSYEDLKGKIVVSQQGSAAFTLAQKLGDKYGFTAKPIAEEANMELALKSGNADAEFFDSAIVAYRIAQEGAKPTVRMIGEALEATDIAFALPKDSPWTKVLNAGLDKLKASGELDKIRKIYVAE